MQQRGRLVLILLTMAMHTLCASAQWHIVFKQHKGWSAAPVETIDSIKITQPPTLDIHFNTGGAASEPHNTKQGAVVSIQPDTILFCQIIPDTLVMNYQNDFATIHNPRLNCIQTDVNGADVTVTATGRRPFVCRATGSSDDGRLVIDSDTTFILVLDGLNLASQKASAISLPQKQRTRIVLADGTVNTLSDAVAYQTDSTSTANGCLYSKGSLTFAGSGTLGVTGSYRHAVSSSKNITVEDGHIIIYWSFPPLCSCTKQVDFEFL